MRLFNKRLEEHFNWKEEDGNELGLMRDFVHTSAFGRFAKLQQKHLMVWPIRTLRCWIDGKRLERFNVPVLNEILVR